MGNLFKKVKEWKHQYHRSKYHTESHIRRLWGTKPYRRSQVPLWRLGGFVKRMLSGCPAYSQEALARERHLEERCLYEHKELLDPGGDGCPSSFTECGAKIHSLEKIWVAAHPIFSLKILCRPGVHRGNSKRLALRLLDPR